MALVRSDNWSNKIKFFHRLSLCFCGEHSELEFDFIAATMMVAVFQLLDFVLCPWMMGELVVQVDKSAFYLV